jgi:hypothetical protein
MSQTFFVLPTHIGPVAFAAIPKCGQHTFAELDTSELPFDRIKEFPIRMAFIRDPLDRLSSCFHFFLHTNYPINGGKVRGYESFIDWALDSDDEHVQPQVELFSRYHFQRRFPISKMTEILELLTGEVIPQANSAPRHEIDQGYRLDDIRERYSEDFDMYSEVLDGLR